MSKKGIMDHWALPQYQPYQSQRVVLDWLESIPSHIRYILVEVPVGGGKSPMGVTYSSWLGNGVGSSFVLTPQKILQRQYEESFKTDILASVYGRVNYECVPKQTDCDIGGNIGKRCDSCPASAAFKTGKTTPNMVLNYALAMMYFRYFDDEQLPPRRLLICDEAHALEKHLCEMDSVVLSEGQCDELGIAWKKSDNLSDAIKWVREVYSPALRTVVNKMMTEIEDLQYAIKMNDRGLTKEEAKMVRKAKSYIDRQEKLDFFIALPWKQLREEFVIVTEDKAFKFKALYGADAFNRYVKPKADRFLFMSATILDKESYCRDLGINPDEAAFVSMESEFKTENRPILFLPTAKMTYGWNEREDDKLRMIEAIESVMVQHEEDSGIIHTGSFQIADWLVGELEHRLPHRIMHHNPKAGISRDEVIDEFVKNDGQVPTILISPSITEGLDLKHTKGRFAIFAKVPYPYLGDEWVKRRQSLSQDWYMRQALINILQGCGRIVRDREDWGYTYILDSSFQYLFNRTKKMIPKWWQQSVEKF